MIAADCAHVPEIIALFSIGGSTFWGLVAAAVAWIVKNIVGWIVWAIQRERDRYDLMKALLAEITSNSVTEALYLDITAASRLTDAIRRDVGPYQPLEPYVALVEKNAVFDNIVESITILPTKVIAAVVDYYNASAGLTKQLQDFREDAFRRLSQARQQQAIRNLFALLGPAVDATSPRARTAISQRMGASRIIGGLGLAAGLLAAFVGVPLLCSAGSRVTALYITPAVEWASTCPSAPRKATDMP